MVRRHLGGHAADSAAACRDSCLFVQMSHLSAYAPDDALFDRPLIVDAGDLRFGPKGAWREARAVSLRAGGCAAIDGDPGDAALFLRVLALRAPVREGRLMLLGRDLRRAGVNARAKLRARIGVCGLGAALAPNLTLAENIALPLRLAGSRGRAYRDDMMELIEDFGLTSEMDTRAEEASASGRAAAALARALVQRPSLLIGDSPFAGLSETIAARALKAVEACRADGAALVFAGLPQAAMLALRPARFLAVGGLIRAAAAPAEVEA